jgi:uncharacterized protein
MRCAWIGWLCFCVLASIGFARGAEPAAIPAASGLLVDEAGALTDEQRGALVSRLQAIQRAERAQVVIVISKGTAGEPLADYALRIAEAWQIGRKQRDDGLLIVVVPSPAGARIEVGYGLEGAIPDARASRWIDDLLPTIRNKEIAKGLDQLLDQIEGVLPEGKTRSTSDVHEVFPGHPDWNIPFILVVFSFFGIFPLFFGRWGGFPSGFLMAAFWGGAAASLWGLTAPTYAVAGAALVLPMLWGLNHFDELPASLRIARHAGNAIGVVLFFSVLSLFVCAGLSAADEPIWPGFIFSGLLATGAAAMLFPAISQPVMIFLRSAMHFVFILVVVWSALGAFIPDAGRIAFAVAATFTALAALGLYLDSRERRGSVAAGGRRWSLWLFGLAIAVAAPFALLALFLAVGGEEARTQLIQAAAGGGTLAGLIALAARIGLIAAVKVGLGGAFGGGGAGRSD